MFKAILIALSLLITLNSFAGTFTICNGTPYTLSGYVNWYALLDRNHIADFKMDPGGTSDVSGGDIKSLYYLYGPQDTCSFETQESCYADPVDYSSTFDATIIWTVDSSGNAVLHSVYNQTDLTCAQAIQAYIGCVNGTAQDPPSDCSCLDPCSSDTSQIFCVLGCLASSADSGGDGGDVVRSKVSYPTLNNVPSQAQPSPSNYYHSQIQNPNNNNSPMQSTPSQTSNQPSQTIYQPQSTTTPQSQPVYNQPSPTIVAPSN